MLETEGAEPQQTLSLSMWQKHTHTQFSSLKDSSFMQGFIKTIKQKALIHKLGGDQKFNFEKESVSYQRLNISYSEINQKTEFSEWD